MVIDKKQALECLAGNEALLDMLINKFITDNQTSSDTITQTIHLGDLETASHLVHSIKGAAGNLSMNDLFVSAKALETSLRQDEAVNPNLLDTFNQDLKAVLALNRN